MAHKGVVAFKQPKKMKQVTGDKNKLKKIKEIKQINKEISTIEKGADKRFDKLDKLFTKRRKAEEQLGI